MANHQESTPAGDPFPEALDHDKTFREVLPNVYMWSGKISISMGLTTSFSRNMVILKQDNEDLVLIHPIRLNEAAFQELDALGTVKHIIRVAAFHGRDDPFYKSRYPNATVWAIEGTKYVRTFDLDLEPHFYPDKYLKEGDELPIQDAKLHTLQGQKGPLEGVIELQRNGKKTLIVGDSLQNFDPKTDPHINWFGYITMGLLGFFRPYNVGPGWSKTCCVPRNVVQDKLLSLQFDNVLPGHGVGVLGDAWKKFEPAVLAMAPL